MTTFLKMAFSLSQDSLKERQISSFFFLNSLNNEALPAVSGNRGSRAFIQGNKETMYENEGNMRTKAILGNRNIENQTVDLGEQGNKAIYFRGLREQVVYRPCEDLRTTKRLF